MFIIIFSYHLHFLFYLAKRPIFTLSAPAHRPLGIAQMPDWPVRSCNKVKMIMCYTDSGSTATTDWVPEINLDWQCNIYIYESLRDSNVYN